MKAVTNSALCVFLPEKMYIIIIILLNVLWLLDLKIITKIFKIDIYYEMYNEVVNMSYFSKVASNDFSGYFLTQNSWFLVNYQEIRDFGQNLKFSAQKSSLFWGFFRAGGRSRPENSGISHKCQIFRHKVDSFFRNI